MLEYLLLLLLTLVAMTVHAVVGFGFAQFVAPVLLLTRSGVEAVSGLLLLALLINTRIAVEGAPPHFRRRDLAVVIPGALVGLPVGALLVDAIDGQSLQALVGIAILLTAGLQLRRRRPNPAQRPPTTGAVSATLAGGLSGVLTTTTAIGAAPVILWLERRTSDGAQLRYAIALYSVLLSGVGVGLLIVQSADEATTGVVLAVTLAPAVFGGHAAGRRLFERVSAETHRTAVLGLVVVAGVASIASGVS